MKKATSYICEHTAEYILVPRLKNILHNKYRMVTPIFPWISREGSNISLQLHNNDNFKLLGLYARRPKLYSANDEVIRIKINEQIQYGSHFGLNSGIPIISGCPLAYNFWELGDSPECLWINVSIIPIEEIDIEIEVERFSKKITQYSEYVFKSDEEIIEFIERTANTIDILTALEAMKNIKMASIGLERYSSMFFMGGYKPVYFLIK